MAAKRCRNTSCLGSEFCEEWECCKENVGKKSKKLSLKKPRFAQPLAEADMNSLCKPPVPANTRKQTDWSVNVFEAWRCARDGEEKCPENILRDCSAETLNAWLCHFVAEVRQVDGLPYPSATLYQLLAGLLKHAHSYFPDFPNFLDNNDVRFRDLCSACENVA